MNSNTWHKTLWLIIIIGCQSYSYKHESQYKNENLSNEDSLTNVISQNNCKSGIELPTILSQSNKVDLDSIGGRFLYLTKDGIIHCWNDQILVKTKTSDYDGILFYIYIVTKQQEPDSIIHECFLLTDQTPISDGINSISTGTNIWLPGLTHESPEFWEHFVWHKKPEGAWIWKIPVSSVASY